MERDVARFLYSARRAISSPPLPAPRIFRVTVITDSSFIALTESSLTRLLSLAAADVSQQKRSTPPGSSAIATLSRRDQHDLRSGESDRFMVRYASTYFYTQQCARPNWLRCTSKMVKYSQSPTGHFYARMTLRVAFKSGGSAASCHAVLRLRVPMSL